MNAYMSLALALSHFRVGDYIIYITLAILILSYTLFKNMSESPQSTNGATTDYEFRKQLQLTCYTHYHKENRITNLEGLTRRFGSQRNAVVQFGARHPEFYNHPYFNDTTTDRETRFRNLVESFTRKIIEGVYHRDGTPYYNPELVAEMERMYQARAALRREHIRFRETPAAASYTKYIVFSRFWFIVIVFIVYGYIVLFGAYEATNLISM
jgi:hypothetical protein